MALCFSVLASGSAGNVAFVQGTGFGLLLDVGLGPRQIATRLERVGATWAQVQAVLLTHTHGDHWRDRTLARLRRQQIRLFCHPEHQAALCASSTEFASLLAEGLVQSYENGRDFEPAPGLCCRPFALSHDSATFGFRLQSREGLFGLPAVVAYAADLGTWTAELAEALADADLLALEFNHDIAMEYASGRSPRLIRRILGDAGHLSNCQAAALLQEVVRRSSPGRLRHVVQLHLSRACNHPSRAAAAAQAVLADRPEVMLYTARQHRPGPTVRVGELALKRRARRLNGARREAVTAPPSAEPWLPGLEP